MGEAAGRASAVRAGGTVAGRGDRTETSFGEDPAGRHPFAKICFRLEHVGGAKEWAWVAAPLSNQLLSHWAFSLPLTSRLVT